MFCCLALDPISPVRPGALEAVARACSPRIESHGERDVVFDASGLRRVLGTPEHIGAEVQRLAAGHGLLVRVCLAGTMTTAWIVAHASPDISVVAPGGELGVLAGLPLAVLRDLPGTAIELPSGRRASARRARHYRWAPGPGGGSESPEAAGPLSIFARWGLRTLGDLARLPRADLRARFGQLGVRLHEAACGEDPAPLVPLDEPRRFLERLELEWPIEGLEPLSFVVGRLCDALSSALEHADRGAVAITTRLTLVQGHFARVLNLPSPMRDARVLRTLVLLDLESHPPDAAIEVVEIELDVTPGRIAQGSLLTYTLPSAETLATLLARLAALMGESRVGAPLLVDTHDERAVAMEPFRTDNRHQASGIRQQAMGNRRWASGKDPGESRIEAHALPDAGCLMPDASCLIPDARCPMPGAVLRRFRLPIPARVITERGAPAYVEPAARGLPASRVIASAGPWRTSGRWWTLDRTSWDRDEWDVELTNGVFRLARDRATNRWELEGAMD